MPMPRPRAPGEMARRTTDILIAQLTKLPAREVQKSISRSPNPDYYHSFRASWPAYMV